MTADTLQHQIREAVLKLLDTSRDLTWNKISDNYKFILTEIKDSQDNFRVQRKLNKKENDKKVPVPLEELMPTLQNLYNDLYDINLYIYKATRSLTTIDIRFYSKSSLDKDYRQTVLQNPPMLHCKIAMPSWLTDTNEKFDINWEHKQMLINWKLFWTRQKFKKSKAADIKFR